MPPPGISLIPKQKLPSYRPEFFKNICACHKIAAIAPDIYDLVGSMNMRELRYQLCISK